MKQGSTKTATADGAAPAAWARAGAGDALARLAGRGLSLLVTLAAILGIGSFLASLVGLMPWLDVAMRFGPTELPMAGAWVQGGIALLCAILALFLPAHERVARLERSHRSFHVGMEDVARAYRIAHEADRRGAFALSGEFDAMRERMAHLRRHPDLAHLEPELLELAAQMSLQGRDLATIYSEANVTRARAFLAQRQEEAARLSEQIAMARSTCAALRDWITDVEAEERRVSQGFRQLERDLQAVLPALGYELEDPVTGAGTEPVTERAEASQAESGDNVVALPNARLAEPGPAGAAERPASPQPGPRRPRRDDRP